MYKFNTSNLLPSQAFTLSSSRVFFSHHSLVGTLGHRVALASACPPPPCDMNTFAPASLNIKSCMIICLKGTVSPLSNMISRRHVFILYLIRSLFIMFGNQNSNTHLQKLKIQCQLKRLISLRHVNTQPLSRHKCDKLGKKT